MSLRRRPRRRAVIGLAAAVVLIACAVLIGLAVSRPVPVSVRSVVIPVIDGPRNEDHVLIDATFFTPPGAGKVPAILLAHGFGQTKTAVVALRRPRRAWKAGNLTTLPIDAPPCAARAGANDALVAQRAA